LCKNRRSFVKVTAYNHREYAGAKNAPTTQLIVNAFGINNVAIRTYKRRTWHNMLEGLWRWLPQTVHPEEEARRQGKKFKDADFLGAKKIRPRLQ